MKKDIIEQAYKLYLEGLSYAEIGRRLNYKADTISKVLRTTYNIAKATNKFTVEQFTTLWEQGKTDKEIAQLLHSTAGSVKTWRCEHGFKRWEAISEQVETLTKEQQQMILGSLLGDLSISKGKCAKEARLCLVQCEKQKELFMKKVEILGPLMGKWTLVEPKPDPRTGKIYKSYRGGSLAHPEITKMYNLLCINGKKTITKEYLEKITSPMALAYWFMDDGCYQGTIATNCFTKAECELLQTWLKETWNIVASVQKNLSQYVLHISAKSRKKWDEMIKPYMLESMMYKLRYK